MCKAVKEVDILEKLLHILRSAMVNLVDIHIRYSVTELKGNLMSSTLYSFNTYISIYILPLKEKKTELAYNYTTVVTVRCTACPESKFKYSITRQKYIF